MLFCGNKFGCRSSKKHEIDGCIKRRIYDTDTNNPILVCPSKNSIHNSYALGLFFMHSSYLLLRFAFFLLWLLFFFVCFLCNSKVTQKKLHLFYCLKKIKNKNWTKTKTCIFSTRCIIDLLLGKNQKQKIWNKKRTNIETTKHLTKA